LQGPVRVWLVMSDLALVNFGLVLVGFGLV